MAAILKNKMAVKRKKKIFLLISTISMGQHNNYYAKVCFLPFQSPDPSPPLSNLIFNNNIPILSNLIGHYTNYSRGYFSST